MAFADTLADIPQRVRDFRQRVGLPDDGHNFTGLEQITDQVKVGVSISSPHRGL